MGLIQNSAWNGDYKAENRTRGVPTNGVHISRMAFESAKRGVTPDLTNMNGFVDAASGKCIVGPVKTDVSASRINEK